MPSDTTKNITLNANNVANVMSRINDSFSFGVNIPSLGKAVRFTPILTSQQKMLIKSAMDPAGISTDFIYTLHDIIKTNCADPSVNVDQLTILDKLFICIKMRMNSIGPILNVTFNDILLEDKTPAKISINLEDLYGRMVSAYGTITSKTITDENNTYTVVCDLPTIGDEYRLNKELQEDLKSNLSDSNTVQSKQSAYAELFVQELVKFVKTITIQTVDSPSTQPTDQPDLAEHERVLDIDLRDKSFISRIKILESLPYAITEKILDYANETINLLDSLLLVSAPVNGTTISHQLEITNSDFFTRS